ncbi:MAG: hypothetical protein ACK5MG_05515 [Bacteroidales bacterium]
MIIKRNNHSACGTSTSKGWDFRNTPPSRGGVPEGGGGSCYKYRFRL